MDKRDSTRSVVTPLLIVRTALFALMALSYPAQAQRTGYEGPSTVPDREYMEKSYGLMIERLSKGGADAQALDDQVQSQMSRELGCPPPNQ